jgi:hypothetical protein
MITYDLGSNVVSNEGFDSMFISLYEMRHTTAVCFNFFDSFYIDVFFSLALTLSDWYCTYCILEFRCCVNQSGSCQKQFSVFCDNRLRHYFYCLQITFDKNKILSNHLNFILW